MIRYILLAFAAVTLGSSTLMFLGMAAIVDGSAIREIEALLVGGFGFVGGAIFLTGALLAPVPKKPEPEWGD